MVDDDTYGSWQSTPDFVLVFCAWECKRRHLLKISLGKISVKEGKKKQKKREMYFLILGCKQQLLVRPQIITNNIQAQDGNHWVKVPKHLLEEMPRVCLWLGICLRGLWMASQLEPTSPRPSQPLLWQLMLNRPYLILQWSLNWCLLSRCIVHVRDLISCTIEATAMIYPRLTISPCPQRPTGNLESGRGLPIKSWKAFFLNYTLFH